MIKYNLDKLVRVQINDFYPARYYSYKKEKKSFWHRTQKEGIYYDLPFNRQYFGFNVPENHTLKDGEIFENPEIILHYQDGSSKIYYFKTYEEAVKFGDEITAIGRWKS